MRLWMGRTSSLGSVEIKGVSDRDRRGLVEAVKVHGFYGIIQLFSVVDDVFFGFGVSSSEFVEMIAVSLFHISP